MKTTFDDVSPFTGERRVMIERDEDRGDDLKLCMDTGYHTYAKLWKTGSELINVVDYTFPNIILNSKREMPDGNTWYKIILITPFVVLMPEECGWVIYNLKDGDPTVDDIIMEVKNENGTLLYRTINYDTKKECSEDCFEMAFDTFQMIGASVYGKIFDIIKEEEE